MSKTGVDDFFAADPRRTLEDLKRMARAGTGARLAATDEDPADLEGILSDGYRDTDLGNAYRFIEACGDRVRFVETWGRWIVYDEATGVWRVDQNRARVTNLAGEVARRLFATTVQLSGRERDAVFQHAKRCEKVSTIEAMLQAARGFPEVLIQHEQLDADPWLLNCRNGTVDLRTGELLPHNPVHLITKSTGVAYNPDATARRFQEFLERVLPDPVVRDYVLRFLGSCATGVARDDVLPVWHGDGANGKSTLIWCIANVLGDYAVAAAPDLFVTSRHETHDTKFADLFRARFAFTVETDFGACLNEERVKLLTGGDRIKARRMREDYWSFSPTHKVVLVTNHKPVVHGTDGAIWRRVHLVPFDVRIEPEEQDPELRDRLREEREGILALIVQGCLDWQRVGLDAPNAVQAASEAYRAEQDLAGRFLVECGVEVDPSRPQHWTSSAMLVNLHRQWCEENGVNHESQWQISSQRLKALGAVPVKSGGIRGWKFVAVSASGG